MSRSGKVPILATCHTTCHERGRSVRAFVLFNLHNLYDGSPKPLNLVIRCSTASESRRTNPFKWKKRKSPGRSVVVQFAILESRMATLGRLLSGRSARPTANGVRDLRQTAQLLGFLVLRSLVNKSLQRLRLCLNSNIKYDITLLQTSCFSHFLQLALALL